MPRRRFAEAQANVLARYGVPAREQWVEVPSVAGRAHVLIAGQGPPIVLLNGIGVPAAMLAPLMAQLPGYTQYAVDLPGYGLTDTTRGFCDDLRANAVRFLVQVCEGLGLDQPVTVVANSLGSLWTSWLAIDEPERVAALVHVGCPAVVLDSSAPLPMRLLATRGVRRLLLRLQPSSPRQVEQLSRVVHEHPLPAEIAELILATELLDHFEEAFLTMLHRLVRLRGARPEAALTASQLSQITAPTLLVFAEHDPMGGPSVGRRVAASLRDAEMHVVPGGHAPWVHYAEEVAAPLRTFLQRRLNGHGRPGRAATA